MVHYTDRNTTSELNGSSTPTRYQCWYLTTLDMALRERIYSYCIRRGGWMSSHPLGLLVWCSAEDSWWILLADPSAVQWRDRDYVD
jgi:hypothetical protein